MSDSEGEDNYTVRGRNTRRVGEEQPAKRSRQSQADGNEIGESSRQRTERNEIDATDGENGDPGSDGEIEGEDPVVEDLLEIDIPARQRQIMSRDDEVDSDGNPVIKPRLMLYYMKVENFKSYRGENLIGPFHQNFSSVIGPNGSGKSNVIDSLLFVFGFNGAQIRTKKASSLIHESDGHKNISSCCVSIHFHLILDKQENGQAYSIIPGSQFSVARRVNRSNVSTYYIDGHKAAPNDVKAKLLEYGMDLNNNRFLILQGEVEMISQMKAKAEVEGGQGMLEYLEEIIGCNRYRSPIERLVKRTEELTELRQNKLDRLSHAIKNLEKVAGPYQEEVMRLTLENRCIRLHNKLWQCYQTVSCSKMNDARMEYHKSKERFKEKDNRLQLLKKERKNREKMLKQYEDEVDKYQVEDDKLHKEFEEMEAKDAKRRQDIKNAKNRIVELEADSAENTKKIEHADDLPAKLTKENDRLKLEVDRLDAALVEYNEDYQKAVTKVEAATRPAQAKKADLEAKLGEMQQDLNDAKAQAEIAKNDLNAVRERYTREQNKLEAKEKELTGANEEIERRLEEVKQLRKRLPELEKTAGRSEQEYRQIKPKMQEAREKSRMTQESLNEAKASMQQSTSHNAVVRVLMDAQNRGEINGVIGRLGDLGGIDRKYDCAVSTACGQLDYILVEDTQTASRCLDVLRRNNLYGNLLSLQKQQHLIPEMRRPFRHEFLPRLFDLIEILDDRYAPAFYFAMRNTLVADSMNQALQAGRHRIVTLDGKMVETSGMMSGGGRPMTGKMGTNAQAQGPTHTAEEIVDLQRESDDALRVARELSNRLEELDRIIRDTRRELTDEDRRLGEANRYYKLAENKRNTLNDAVANQRKVVDSVKPNEAEVAERDDIVQSKAAAYKKISGKYGGVEEEIKRVDEEIQAKTDEVTGDSRRRVDAATKEKQEHEKMINNNKSRITKANRDTVRLKKKLQDIQADLEEQNNKIQELRDLNAEIDRRAQEIMDRIQQNKEDKETSQKNYDEAKAKLEEEGTESIALEKECQEMRETVDGQKHVYNKLKEKTAQWEAEVAGLKLNDLAAIMKLNREDLDIEAHPTAIAKTLSEGNAVESASNPSTEGSGDNPTAAGSSSLNQATDKQTTDTDDQVDEVNEENALMSHEEELRREIVQGTELEKFAEEDMLNLAKDEQKLRDLKAEDATAKAEVDAKKPNDGIIAEYHDKKQKFDEADANLKEVTDRRDKHRFKTEQFRKARLDEFFAGFSEIAESLKEMYQMITLGGDAELEPVDTMDPFQGINFSVRPPKKSWKQISNLSGGEKTLSSLALVFALHKYRPTPIYVMDEIDAALDYRNVSIVGHYIKERTKNAQFIIISLRNQMFELADRLVGIYKTFDSTKNVVIDPDKIATANPGIIKKRKDAEDAEKRRLLASNRGNTTQASAVAISVASTSNI